MSKIMFDTLQYAESLESAGFDKKQAKALTNAQHSLVTEITDEFGSIRSEITEVRSAVGSLRTEMHQEIGKIHQTIGDLKSEIGKSTTRLTISLGIIMAVLTLLSNLDKIITIITHTAK
ncbi:MAG: hypothetical protein KGV46_02725 [Pasteurella sp.]|nr:hypothetical protein [Pasteurella sp.]